MSTAMMYGKGAPVRWGGRARSVLVDPDARRLARLGPLRDARREHGRDLGGRANLRLDARGQQLLLDLRGVEGAPDLVVNSVDDGLRRAGRREQRVGGRGVEAPEA